MNLRQQFFWKILLGLSGVIILLSSFNLYSKYFGFDNSENISFIKKQKEYKKEYIGSTNMLEKRADYISRNQENREHSQPNFMAIRTLGITNHVRAGIKTNTNSWDSKDPIYRGTISTTCIIEYRDAKNHEYNIGEKIEGTEMIVESCDEVKLAVKINGEQQIFYKLEEEKND